MNLSKKVSCDNTATTVTRHRWRSSRRGVEKGRVIDSVAQEDTRGGKEPEAVFVQ